MVSYKTLLENALKLRPIERAQLVEGIMTSLEKPDSEIDSIWEEEAIKRYEAFKEKRINAKDLEEVMKRYE
jgi:putative addiction module component (TIGR02574 family)